MPISIAQVMTPDVTCTRPDATLHQAARLMADHDVGALPVRAEPDRLVGILTDRDIVTRAVAEGQDPVMTHVRTVMTPEVVTVLEDQDVTEALRLMEHHHVRRLVVLNRRRRVTGIVTLGDLAAVGADVAPGVIRLVERPAAPARAAR